MLRLVSWPYVRKHRLRSALTVVAIAIGVAVFVAMRIANTALLGSFQETVNRVAGATELQITAGELGFGEEVLERVQEMPHVRVAAPVIEAVVGTGLEGQGNLLVMGVDMTGDRSLRSYELAAGGEPLLDDPLVFLAQPDSLIVSETFAARNGLTLDSRVPLQTMDGEKPFTIRGILKPSGLASAFGGNMAIMDVYAAQHVFGRGRTFGRIDVAVTEGASVSGVQATLQQALGPGFEVQPPSSRGQSFASLLRIYRFLLVFSSAFALLVGMFIIYNTFGIAVSQRRSEIGLLRALGATKGQIFRIFVGESLVFGLIGSLLGIVIGQLAAGGVAAGAAGIVEGVYGVSGLEARPGIDAAVVVLALAAGVVTSALAAAMPAHAASRVDPAVALQKGRVQALEARHLRGISAAGVAALVIGVSTLQLTESGGGFYIGYGAMLTGALLLTPLLSVLLTRAIKPLLIWLRPVEGALAADSLLAASRRTAATVVALMLSLALTIGLAGIARGAYAAITGWVATALNPDLFVTASPTLTDRNYRFPGTMTGALGKVRGVAEAHRQRMARVPFRGTTVRLNAIEMANTHRRSPRQALEGDLDRMFGEAAHGRGLIVSENFSSLFGSHSGDTITLSSPTGDLALPILGVIREYGDQQGALFIDYSLFSERWKDDSVDIFRIYVAPGAAPEQVKTDILSAFSDHQRIFVLENADVRRYVSGLTGQWFSMSYAQLAVAMLVAVLGIVNSITVSVTDRKRELGILRAVGGLGRQVRLAIWMEALGVGLVSLALGLGVGAMHLYGSLEMTARDFPGLRFDYMYPYGVAAALVPVILGSAVLGALAPAESAVRSPLVEALEYE
jgi:putative ABC transport system permease protein